MHQQVGGSKVLGSRGQVLRHARRAVGEKTGRIRSQLLPRELRDRVLDLGAAGQEQRHPSDQLEAAIHALEDHARHEGKVCNAIAIGHRSCIHAADGTLGTVCRLA